MGKWLRRVLIWLLVLLGALVLVALGLFAFDVFFGPKTADVANTTYTNGAGVNSYGYLALPDEPGPHPGVLLLHEWWGLNHGITVLADALAREGYVVFAPDAYRGRVAAQIPRALYLRLTTPEAEVTADLDAALAHLLALPEVDAARVASFGFCFGGEHSLLLSLRQPESIPYTVIYYGDVIPDANRLEPLRDSRGVLGVFAAEDQQIPVSDVAGFEAALDELGVSNEITVYPGVGHAFINEDNYDQPGPAGDAWRQGVEFLARNLKSD